MLDGLFDWNFDVFALHAATNGAPLTVGGMHLMQRMGVLAEVPIPRHTGCTDPGPR